MKNNRPNIETTALFLLGLLFLLIRVSSEWLKKSEITFIRHIFSTHLDKGFDQLLILYGLMLLGMAITSYLLGLEKTSLIRELLLLIRSNRPNISEIRNRIASVLKSA